MPDDLTNNEVVDIDSEDDAPGESPATLEEKYKEQMRQIMPQKIELPISTLSDMIKEQIQLNPHFQRRGRWDQARQSRFIESIIMNVPIPPVFLGEDEYGMYVVLDGRQRLTAINEFLKNNYTLKGLKVWEELNGKNFNDMKKANLDRFFTRRFVPAVVILKESSPEVKYDVFDRLNTGGITATPMEIRNAVFQGGFNKLLKDLSDNHTFRKLWGIPTSDLEREENETYARMEDVEIVLRFFALRDYSQMVTRFKDYLSLYLRERNAQYKETPSVREEDKRAFHNAVTNCWRIFGANAFRKPATGNRSAPLADAYMVALASVEPTAFDDESVSIRVRAALKGLLEQDAAFQQAIGAGTNGKGAIETRIKMAVAAVQSALN